MPDMPAITAETLIAILDSLKADYGAVIDQLDLNAPSAIGEWTPRQVLSHIIGSLQRVPIQAGYFLSSTPHVPVTFSDPYWMSEWQNAPIKSFKAAFDAGIEANKALVLSLSPDVLARVLPVQSFGDMSLAVFLLVNYKNHLEDAHLHQLRAFLSAPQPT